MKPVKLFLIICACFALLLPLARTTQANPVTGVYRLTTRGQQGMCLDINNFANANGSAVQLWSANKSTNQQWLVERQADGTYKIYAYSGINSLQMLAYAGGSTANGNAVTTYEDNGTNNQLWYFVFVGNGWYRIVPKNAGSTGTQTLEIAGGATAGQGAKTQIWQYLGTDNQVFRLDWAGPTKVYANPKKGIGGRETKAASMHCSWYYTWSGDRPGDAPSGVEFVPMEWGYYGNANNGSVNWLNYVKGQPGVQRILAFNEPDHTDQSNLSVASALDGYQYLSNLGIPVGSPACADAGDSWMQSFMSGAAQKNYRIDFVCVHTYVTDPNGFLGYLSYIHNLYGKPLWVTEFAPADWSGNNGVSVQQAMNFMRTVVPALNNLSYVQRYAWYTGASPRDGTLGSSALVNDDGTLTALGKLYNRM